MTQADFDKYKGLMRLGSFMEVTGLNKEDVGAMVENKEIRVYHAPARKGGKYKGTRAFYYKADAARIAGFKL